MNRDKRKRKEGKLAHDVFVNPMYGESPRGALPSPGRRTLVPSRKIAPDAAPAAASPRAAPAAPAPVRRIYRELRIMLNPCRIAHAPRRASKVTSCRVLLP